MDIRKWFTSPKGASHANTKVEKNKKEVDISTKTNPKKNKLAKKRLLSSDSDEEVVPTKNKSKKKKSNKFADDLDSEENPLPTKTIKSKKKFNAIDKNLDSEEEKPVPTKTVKSKKNFGTIDKDLEISSKQISKSPQKSPQLKKSEHTKLKPISISDFFGNAPIQKFKTNGKKEKSSLEKNHEDEDFCETLSKLDQTTAKESYQEKRKSNKDEMVDHDIKEEKIVKKQRSLNKSSKSTNLVELEIEVKPKKSSEKILEDKIPPKKNKGNIYYASYLNREGPRALGSKEIPEGEPDCLLGFTFIITGILESMERDEAKSLIEKYGGKVMTTLSKNTHYIVIGRDAGSSKLEKAEKLGTKQLDEDGMLELIRTMPGKSDSVKLKKTYGKNNKTISSMENLKDENDSLKKTDDKYYQSVSIMKNLEENGKFLKKENCNSSSIQNINKDENGNEDISIYDRDSGFIDNGSQFNELNSESTIELNLKNKSKKTNSDISFNMWVDKYKPLSLNKIIGQQGDKSNANKLLSWLKNWDKSRHLNKKPPASGRNYLDDGSFYKAALLSGPPGVGKTTTAQLVCKEAGYDIFELNASDTRSKKNLQHCVSELLGNQTLAGCFTGLKTVSSKHAIIMDEVDGMSGNEDRGGMQELINFIKSSKIPIICICNDRNHLKIRSLSNYCFDLRFQKPRVEQIKAAMLSIAYREGIKVTPNVLHEVIVAANQDIRQVLHNMSLWSSKNKTMSSDQTKVDIGKGIKHIKLGPFDVLRDVFTIGNNPKATLIEKSDLFFHDYSMAPLFVQENYPHVIPSAAQGDKKKHLRLLSETANSICIGDMIDKQIRSNNSWSLLPMQAIYASVIPGELLKGVLRQMINFPAWLGQNSKRNRMDRILQELNVHMRMKITGNKTDVALEYLPLLKRTLTEPLIQKESDGINEAINIMEEYYLLREDFDSIIDLSLWPNQQDPRLKINTKVKTAFTKTYNKECSKNPYTITNVKKKKVSAKDIENETMDEENLASEEEEDDILENDAMIKIKKQKNSTNSDEPSKSRARKSKKSKK